MLSLENLAAVRIALELCNNSELKKEILFENESDYEIYNSHNQDDEIKQTLKQWHEKVENKAAGLIEKLCLIKQLREKVSGIVIVIGMRMLKWISYHEAILGLTREFSIKFLNSSLFRSQGILNNEKAAAELMKDNSLNIKHKYKLSCVYCLTEHIPDLYRQMSQEDKEECCEDYYHYNDEGSSEWIQQSELVKFCSFYLTGDTDELRGDKIMDEYMMESAVRSGSKAAVEYWLEKTDVRTEEDAVMDAALETIRNTVIESENWDEFLHDTYTSSWIPSDYFVDILCFLLSKMTQDQLIEFLKRDIEDLSQEEISQNHPHDQLSPVFSRVLECLLSCPEQNYFMNTAKLMWEFLPECSYAILLLKICNRIDPRVGDLNYGEERLYDSRKLLREFWYQSPDRYKRFVITGKNQIFMDNYENALQEKTYITCLLYDLLTLRNFTYEDRKNIELILDSATDEEKESIILSVQGKDICIELVKEERWEILEEFVSNCHPSKEKAEKFKKGFSITEEVQRVCISFVTEEKWTSAESFIRWSSLTEEEILQVKKEMIYSCYGRFACWHLFLDENVGITIKFCEWFLSSEEEIIEFKKKLIFSLGLVHYADLISEEKLEVVDEFINWSLLSQEEIGEFKKELCNEWGNYICENLISDVLRRSTFHKKSNNRLSNEFKGGKWEEVEKYLIWCSLSEEEIRDFKKIFLKKSGTKIHYNLIKCNQYEEAEKLFVWLGLSHEEVKELKKETLWKYNYNGVSDMIGSMMCNLEIDKRFSDDERRLETTELFLRWFLTDKETVLAFKDRLNQIYKWKQLTQEDLEFDSAIERRLSDLEEEQKKENLN